MINTRINKNFGHLLKNLSLFIFVVLALCVPESWASQCVTYQGYKKANGGCKSKYTPLVFGIDSFCKREGSCNRDGLPKLKQSISYRKYDVQKLTRCLVALEGNPDRARSICPKYKDILGSDGNPDRDLVKSAIDILTDEVSIIDNKVAQIEDGVKALQTAKQVVGNVCGGAVEGVRAVARAVIEPAVAIADVARTAPDREAERHRKLEDIREKLRLPITTSDDDVLKEALPKMKKEIAILRSHYAESMSDALRSGDTEKFIKLSDAVEKLNELDEKIDKGEIKEDNFGDLYKDFRGLAGYLHQIQTLRTRHSDKRERGYETARRYAGGSSDRDKMIRNGVQKLYRDITDFGGKHSHLYAIVMSPEKVAAIVELTRLRDSLNMDETDPIKFLDAYNKYQELKRRIESLSE